MSYKKINLDIPDLHYKCYIFLLNLQILCITVEITFQRVYGFEVNFTEKLIRLKIKVFKKCYNFSFYIVYKCPKGHKNKKRKFKSLIKKQVYSFKSLTKKLMGSYVICNSTKISITFIRTIIIICLFSVVTVMFNPKCESEHFKKSMKYKKFECLLK